MITRYVDISDVTKKCILKVNIIGVKKFRLRLKTAILIFKFGAWIAGMGIEISEDL